MYISYCVYNFFLFNYIFRLALTNFNIYYCFYYLFYYINFIVFLEFYSLIYYVQNDKM